MKNGEEDRKRVARGEGGIVLGVEAGEVGREKRGQVKDGRGLFDEQERRDQPC